MRDGDGLRDGCGSLEAENLQVERVGIVRRPAQGVQKSVRTATEERTPGGRAQGERHRLGALHPNGFLSRGDFAVTVGGAVVNLRGGIGLHEDHVGGVHVGVGETPGDAAVAARNEQRHAGQSDADKAVGRAAGIGPGQHRAIPGVRHAVVEVHVVGEQGCAAGGVGTAHGEAVGAGFGGIDSEGGGLLRSGATALQAETGQRCVGESAAIERRIPRRAARREKIDALRTKSFAQREQAEFVVSAGVLQIQPHGIDDEQAVFRAPRLRVGAEHGVFPWDAGQLGEPGVHAGGVSFEEFTVCGGQPRQHLPGERAESVQPVGPVERHGGGPEKLGEFARAVAPHQVHLEKTFLCVNIAGGAGHVGTCGAGEGRHTERVALDFHGAGEPRQRPDAVERRQAGADAPPDRADRNQRQHQQDAQNRDEELEAFPERVAHGGIRPFPTGGRARRPGPRRSRGSRTS